MGELPQPIAECRAEIRLGLSDPRCYPAGCAPRSDPIRSCRCAYGSLGPGQQDRLIVPLLALRTSHQAAHFPQAGCLDLETDVVRCVEMALELDLMAELTVCRGNVARAFAGLESDEQMAGRAENPGGLREDARLAGGRRG